jgi:ferredoxin-NADP reductase
MGWCAIPRWSIARNTGSAARSTPSSRARHALADPAGRPLLRSYSLSGAPGARDYRISVKREEHGAASQFLHTRLRTGDLLEAAAPRGTFTLRPGQTPILLVSAGVGATPVLAMLHSLAAARSTRDIW